MVEHLKIDTGCTWTNMFFEVILFLIQQKYNVKIYLFATYVDTQ